MNSRIKYLSPEIQIGTIMDLMKKREVSIAEDLFLAGSIIIIGIYHFGLFYLRRKEKSYFYFAILCILDSYLIIQRFGLILFLRENDLIFLIRLIEILL